MPTPTIIKFTVVSILILYAVTVRGLLDICTELWAVILINTCLWKNMSSSNIGQSMRIYMTSKKSYIDQQSTEKLIHALVHSHIDYCNALLIG